MTFAFIFESVGGTEWLLLLGVVLIVVGPKNLPAAARKMGQIMSTLRRAADEFKRQVMSMDQEVTNVVSDATSDATTSTTDPYPSSDNDSSADVENGEDLYGDDNPYPGHDGYYDDMQDQDGSVPDSDGGDVDRAVAESGQGETHPAEEAKHVPTEEELRAVKITVTTDASRRGAGA